MMLSEDRTSSSGKICAPVVPEITIEILPRLTSSGASLKSGENSCLTHTNGVSASRVAATSLLMFAIRLPRSPTLCRNHCACGLLPRLRHFRPMKVRFGLRIQPVDATHLKTARVAGVLHRRAESAVGSGHCFLGRQSVCDISPANFGGLERRQISTSRSRRLRPFARATG